MAEHDFQINFTVNNAQTQQAREEEKAGYKAVEQVADQSIKAIQKATDEAAKERVQKIQEALSAEQVAAKAREQLIAQQNRAAIKAAVDELDTVKQSERAKAEAIKATSEAQKKAAKDAAEAAKQAAQQQVAAAKEAAQQQASWTSAIQGTVGSLLSMASAAGAITSLGAAISYVGGQFDAINKQAMDAASTAAGFRDRLKEIASLTGRPNADAQTIQREMEIRRQTLQSAGDVTALQTSAMGLSAAVVGDKGKISNDEFRNALISAGQIQAIKGVDASSMGKMLGGLTLNAPGQVTGDDLKRQMLSLFKVADLGAMTPAQFSEGFAKTAPMVTSGDYKSLPEMAAIMSTMSFGGAEQVPERMRQLSRLTKGSINDVSKPAGSQMSPAEYLKGLGATDQMDTRSILELMAKDVEGQTAAAAKDGKTLSLDTYLRQRGYGSVEDISAFKTYNAYRGQLNDTFLPAATNLPTTQEADKQLRQLQMTPQGFTQRAALSEDEQKIGQGVGAGEYSQAYKRELFARLKTRDQGFWTGWKGDYADSQSGLFAPTAFRGEMLQDLRKKSFMAGIDDKSWGFGAANPFVKLQNANAGSTEEANAITDIITRIQGAGGSALGSKETDEILKQQLDSAKKTEGIMQSIADKLPGVPALNAKPGGNNAGRMP